MKIAIPFDILLVEDNPGHAILIQTNLRKSGISNLIHHVDDGQKALDYVLGAIEDVEDDDYKPILILLDLNLPVLSGYQVLERLKAHPIAKKIPIIVLTSTQDEAEIERCYQLGCNVFLSKPVEYDEFQNSIRQISLFLSIVRVPHV